MQVVEGEKGEKEVEDHLVYNLEDDEEDKEDSEEELVDIGQWKPQVVMGEGNKDQELLEDLSHLPSLHVSHPRANSNANLSNHLSRSLTFLLTSTTMEPRNIISTHRRWRRRSQWIWRG